jgi:hypothetical protein
VSITSAGSDVGGKLAAMVTTEIETLVGHVPRTERDCIVRVATSVLDTPVESSRGVRRPLDS